VYNFSTKRQWYTASNLIVHNCRCVDEPVLPDEDVDALRAAAIARQEEELRILQSSPTVQGEIPNRSSYSNWNAKRIAALREGTRAAVGL
jgi:hypothetical protein